MSVGIVGMGFDDSAKCSHRTDRISFSLLGQAEMGLRLGEVGLKFDCCLQFLERAVRVFTIGQHSRQIVMGGRVLRSEIGGALQERLRFFEFVLLPPDDSEMKLRGSERRLQAHSFRKLRGGLVELRILHEHRAKFVAQLRTRRREFDGARELFDRAGQVGLKAQHASQGAAGFGIIGREFDGGACFRDRAFDIVLRGERSRQIDVRLDEIGLQPERLPELRDPFVEVSGIHQHPTEGVVGFGRLRRKTDYFFEGDARGGEIMLLDGVDALLVKTVDGGFG
ncbi:MAG TPA: hypothetical protein VF478_07155, partial [Anaerolineae bacterium]